MNFEIIGEIAEVETIAVSASIRILPVLRRRFGHARWRKRKGFAMVRLADETVRHAEIHWFEAHWNRQTAYENQTVLGLKGMTEHQHASLQFAICSKTDDVDLLTPRRIYQVLPDDSAAKSYYVRVLDNEGEDYLYPADYFIFVEFPHEVEQALLQVS
jgi:hypothetical protein